MAKIPIRIITDSNDRNPTAGLIDRRFGLSADWVIADSGMAGGVLPITLAEFQAGSANFMQSLAGETPAAWYQFNNGITVTGAGVSQWSDQSGNGRHLLQGTDTNRPAKQSDGSILFDGVDNFLATDAFTLNQPASYYLLMKQISWTSGEGFLDGTLANTQAIFQTGASPSISLYAGSAAAANTDLVLGSYGAVAAVFNGASSVLQVNDGTPTTGNPGAGNAGGIVIGSAGAGGGQFGHCQVKEVIAFASAHSAATRRRVIAYLRSL